MLNRPTAPLSWPLAKPTTAVGKKATELHGAWVEQFARVEKVEADHAQAQADVTAAEEAIAAADSAKASEAAEKQYAAAKDALDGPWQARLKGPVTGSNQAEAELRQFVTDKLVELLTEPELADAAGAAREGVVAGVEAINAGLEEWRRVAAAHTDLVKVAYGIDARAVPTLTPSASAIASATADMLAAEASNPVLGSNGLPAPTVSEDALKELGFLPAPIPADDAEQ